MDNSLVQLKKISDREEQKVLILVVMDNSLVLNPQIQNKFFSVCLNPCCNGQ